MSSMSLYTSQRCALFVYLKCTHTYLNHRLLYDSFFSFRCVLSFFFSCDGNSLFAKLIFPIFIESNRFTSTVARTSLNFSIKTFQTEVFISFNFFWNESINVEFKYTIYPYKWHSVSFVVIFVLPSTKFDVVVFSVISVVWNSIWTRVKLFSPFHFSNETIPFDQIDFNKTILSFLSFFFFFST